MLARAYILVALVIIGLNITELPRILGMIIGDAFTPMAVALFFSSFTTLLAYYYIAETNVAYIHRTIKIPGLVSALKVGLVTATFHGTIKTAELTWGVDDIGVGIMARPAIKALRDYEMQRKGGVEQCTFDPVSLGIKNADFWEDRIKESTTDVPGVESSKDSHNSTVVILST